MRSEEQVRTLCQACAPKPVNILSAGLPVEVMAKAGARRISLGGSLAAVAYGTAYLAAQEIAEKGTFGAIVSSAPSRPPLNPIFAGP
jgi:2-methylisocitrate lyase-like PEP mutase family enzyme